MFGWGGEKKKHITLLEEKVKNIYLKSCEKKKKSFVKVINSLKLGEMY